jgi:hypothetical protein
MSLYILKDRKIVVRPQAGQTDNRLDRQTTGWTERQQAGKTDNRMDRLTIGWTKINRLDSRTIGWTGRQPDRLAGGYAMESVSSSKSHNLSILPSLQILPLIYVIIFASGFSVS